jgi:hypothetical protein
MANLLFKWFLSRSTVWSEALEASVAADFLALAWFPVVSLRAKRRGHAARPGLGFAQDDGAGRDARPAPAGSLRALDSLT